MIDGVSRRKRKFLDNASSATKKAKVRLQLTSILRKYNTGIQVTSSFLIQFWFCFKNFLVGFWTRDPKACSIMESSYSWACGGCDPPCVSGGSTQYPWRTISYINDRGCVGWPFALGGGRRSSWGRGGGIKLYNNKKMTTREEVLMMRTMLEI